MIRFVAIESLLLGGLTILAGYLALESWGHTLGTPFDLSRLPCCQDHGRWESAFTIMAAMSICCIPIAGYWLLERLGMIRLAFWSVTLATLLVQCPAVIAHNGIDWFPARSHSWGLPELHPMAVAGWLLSSLVLLVILHRIADLRRLYAKLESLELEYSERQQVMRGEFAVLGGLVSVSFIVTSALLVGAAALTEMDTLLTRFPWTVFTVGVAAVCLLGWFVHLWFRRQDGN